jgi:hypothetical protein
MTALREDIADIKQRLEDAERSATEVPHREKYLLLATGFLRRLVELHVDLVDEVERELGAGAGAQTAR